MMAASSRLLRHGHEIADQHVDRERDGEGGVGQNHADIGVDEMHGGERHEQRIDQHDPGKHLAEQDADEQRPLAAEREAREHIGRHDRQHGRDHASRRRRSPGC